MLRILDHEKGSERSSAFLCEVHRLRFVQASVRPESVWLSIVSINRRCQRNRSWGLEDAISRLERSLACCPYFSRE